MRQAHHHRKVLELYREEMRRCRPLCASQLLECLRRRRRSKAAFRRLVEHFLPLAAKEASRGGKGTAERIERANRILLQILRHARLAPWDDAEAIVLRLLRRGLQKP